MAWYLTIRADSHYSRTAASEPLIEYLRTLPELAQTGSMEFRDAPGEPWVCLVLAMSRNGGYAVSGELLPVVNVVELVCSDGDEDWYESLAARIAAFLDWEAVEESGDRIIRSAS
jgi:hypothetical protein